MPDYKAPDAEVGENEDDGGEKLRLARQLFEEAVDHTRDAHAEAHRAIRFYHNTRLEGQWESNDLAYLRDEGRPAFSFNIVKDKVDSFLGIYSDAQRSPQVMGSGNDDKLHAEVLNIVKDQILEDAKYERKKSGQLRTGSVAGECGMHVEVVPSSKGKDWIEVNLYRIMPFEIHWDASSIDADRSDARHVFWDRWLSKGEFKEAYPKDADMWGQLSNNHDPADVDAMGSWSEDSPDDFGDALDDYDGEKHSRYYFDRQKRKVRVIRYEYKEFAEKIYVTNTLTGERREVDEEQERRVKMAIDMGGPFELEEVNEEVIRVCEFVGPKLLAEYDSPGPFDGFSIVDFVYMMDEEEGTPYGMVRNLFDPQMEINKSKSLEIEYIAQATAPGTIVEEDSIVDEAQFAAEIRRPGGMPIAKKGALAEGRIQQKQITPPSPAIMQRFATAMDLIDKISGIPSSGNVQPASQQEAATTVALRYHKQRQVVQDPIANFENAQNEITNRIVQAITRAMPDDQIEAVLANKGKYKVGNGYVVEMAQNPEQPEGPPIPKGRAALRDLRDMNWNIELEHSSDNSTLRMMELDVAMKLVAAGVPYDPDELIGLSTGSRAKRERLKAYVEKAQRAQAQGAAQEAQALQQQTAQFAQLEAGKLQETARHNRVEESLKHGKQTSDASAKLAELWEKSDENEKEFVLSMLENQQKQREQALGAY